MDNFSSALKLTDLNDFIHPSQMCIKPELITKKNHAKKANIQVKKDGLYLEMGSNGTTEVLESAKITLNDCLACSGCITSAESVLVTTQSTKEFLSSLQTIQNEVDINKRKLSVVSISPQTRASIAAHFRLNALQAYRKLIYFLKTIGIDYVFDTSFSREFSLMEAAAEFIARKRKTIDAPLPMLASACPGWVCYAEKMHGDFILPYISTTKSPQQIMGTLVKYYFGAKQGKTADQIYHVTIMPCYDKKLEASRDDFYNDLLHTKDVDCVLTSAELLDLINERTEDFRLMPEPPILPLFSNVSKEGNLFGNDGGGSGGYLEYIFKRAAKELYGVIVEKIEYQQTARNPDLKTVQLCVGDHLERAFSTLLVTSSPFECVKVNGNCVMSFAAAYGFRNIQNIVRKIKRDGFSYDFVEVMACPSGEHLNDHFPFAISDFSKRLSEWRWSNQT